jgi:SPP1 family predicted phage head-tail adaptor
MNPGAFNQRLTLELPTETADGGGGVVRGFAAGPRLWASVTPVGARPALVADASGATVTHRILTRARTDITTRAQLRKGARLWRIVAVRDEDNGHLLRIDAEERRD